MLLGVAALAIAGLYALTLVAGRAPVISNNIEIKRIFDDALVVHVDLSVLVWFLAMACMTWSMATASVKHFIPYLEEAALICMGLAVALMTLSPFMPGAEAYKSNYIPVLSTPLFHLSLALILCAVGLMLFKLFTTPLQIMATPLTFGIVSSGWITAMSILCFFWSYHLMPSVIEGEQYFDMMFWGGGHVLQLTHTQIVMVLWWLVAASILPQRNVSQRLLNWMFLIGLLAALASPVAYFLYAIESMEFRNFFTHHMISVSGIAPGITALILFVWLCGARAVRKSEHRALWSTLLMSVVLFLYGGALGLLITGQNVVIPAHYHGSIVGLTLGFMAYAYLMLPQFGYRPVSQWRMAYWQPIIYGGGQLIHISALAYSGGYGVLRKTAGGVSSLPMDVKIALGFFGLGGLIAIIGGLMFVVVVWRSIRK